ncbi:MAG: hypothetical protein QGF36_06335 [Candidatus Marinimicrobia bacterium]|nr:hypothetical protein [Candidatus Neomarinimicrobiota bacterium]MDP6937032.1 hypothetical protein [Candidatus Neomarinimicrobiota bacterium]
MKIQFRWLVVFGAILIQLALGAIYAWSVFTPLLIDPHGYYQFSAQQTAWIFSTGLAFLQEPWLLQESCSNKSVLVLLQF